MDKQEQMLNKTEARWKRADGSALACTEKIKVLNENFDEIREHLKDALDDAVLMGCSETSFKKIYLEMISELHSEYPEQIEQKKDGS